MQNPIRVYPFKPYHPEDAHELHYADGQRYAVPMSSSRFVSLLRYPNQSPTGRRPGELWLHEEVSE
jgi:hypothetical protein